MMSFMLRISPRFAWRVVPVLCLIVMFGASWTALSQEDPTPTVDPAVEADASATPGPTPTPPPQPDPFETFQGQYGSARLLFEGLPQGGVGVVKVVGEGITEASAVFLDRVILFFPARDEGLFALLTVNIEQAARVYPLSITLVTDSGRETLEGEVTVTLGGFIRSSFAIPDDRQYLIDPEVERAEFARLSAVFAAVTPERAWNETGFSLPIPSVLTSQFGEVRLMNDTVETRHTGWDLRAAVGTPIMASAAGRVAFAGVMDIRGNYVVIDHGYGVYSGYAHLSQIHVTRGQVVTKDQVLGLSGNTGRSGGPHLHWEMNINGDWIDSADFIRMWVP
jgi:murein DD-endopeptidase MepM/ murein hydrolase activator NlpD